MRKTCRMKALVALAMVATLGSVSTAFAETSTIPVKLNKDATVYSVTVSEALNLDFKDSFTATSNIDVQNNSNVGVIEVTEIAQITGKNGWEVKPVATEDYWKNLQLNSKEFGLQYDGDTAADLSIGVTTGDPLQAVNPGATEAMSFTGFVGGTTEAVTSDNITDVVLTLGFSTAATN